MDQFSSSPKKILSAGLAAVLLTTAPGLAPYQALAAQFNFNLKSNTNPATAVLLPGASQPGANRFTTTFGDTNLPQTAAPNTAVVPAMLIGSNGHTAVSAQTPSIVVSQTGQTGIVSANGTSAQAGHVIMATADPALAGKTVMAGGQSVTFVSFDPAAQSGSAPDEMTVSGQIGLERHSMVQGTNIHASAIRLKTQLANAGSRGGLGVLNWYFHRQHAPNAKIAPAAVPIMLVHANRRQSSLRGNRETAQAATPDTSPSVAKAPAATKPVSKTAFRVPSFLKSLLPSKAQLRSGARIAALGAFLALGLGVTQAMAEETRSIADNALGLSLDTIILGSLALFGAAAVVSAVRTGFSLIDWENRRAQQTPAPNTDITARPSFISLALRGSIRALLAATAVTLVLALRTPILGYGLDPATSWGLGLAALTTFMVTQADLIRPFLKGPGPLRSMPWRYLLWTLAWTSGTIVISTMDSVLASLTLLPLALGFLMLSSSIESRTPSTSSAATGEDHSAWPVGGLLIGGLPGLVLGTLIGSHRAGRGRRFFTIGLAGLLGVFALDNTAFAGTAEVAQNIGANWSQPENILFAIPITLAAVALTFMAANFIYRKRTLYNTVQASLNKVAPVEARRNYETALTYLDLIRNLPYTLSLAQRGGAHKLLDSVLDTLAKIEKERPREEVVADMQRIRDEFRRKYPAASYPFMARLARIARGLDAPLPAEELDYYRSAKAVVRAGEDLGRTWAIGDENFAAYLGPEHFAAVFDAAAEDFSPLNGLPVLEFVSAITVQHDASDGPPTLTIPGTRIVDPAPNGESRRKILEDAQAVVDDYEKTRPELKFPLLASLVRAFGRDADTWLGRTLTLAMLALPMAAFSAAVAALTVEPSFWYALGGGLIATAFAGLMSGRVYDSLTRREPIATRAPVAAYILWTGVISGVALLSSMYAIPILGLMGGAVVALAFMAAQKVEQLEGRI